jgi:hypothetical protein
MKMKSEKTPSKLFSKPQNTNKLETANSLLRICLITGCMNTALRFHFFEIVEKRSPFFLRNSTHSTKIVDTMINIKMSIKHITWMVMRERKIKYLFFKNVSLKLKSETVRMSFVSYSAHRSHISNA